MPWRLRYPALLAALLVFGAPALPVSGAAPGEIACPKVYAGGAAARSAQVGVLREGDVLEGADVVIGPPGAETAAYPAFLAPDDDGRWELSPADLAEGAALICWYGARRGHLRLVLPQGIQGCRMRGVTEGDEFKVLGASCR